MLPISRSKKSSRRGGPLISESCDRPGLRMFLLCCLFSLIVSAYWWNFEKRLAKIQPPDGSHSIMDEDKLLSKQEERLLYAWRAKFQKEWNVPLLVQVSEGGLVLPPYAASTLYVGAGLEHAEAVIAVPPLVRKALGEGLRIEAEEGLKLCLKQSASVQAYVQMKEAAAQNEGQDEGLSPPESSHMELAGQGVAVELTHCLDTTLNHIWKAL